MILGTFLRGVIIGVAIAAPVGPVALLCIRHTLAQGRLHGLASGVGAALGDTFYGAIAGLGLTAISDFLLGHQTQLRFFGGLLLLFLGWRAWRTTPDFTTDPTPGRRRGLLSALLSTMLLTLTNPMTVVAFLGIYAVLGLSGSWVLIAGVFSGALLWWGTLTMGVGALRPRMAPRFLVWVNRAAGVLIAAFGLLVLLSALLGPLPLRRW